MDLRWINDEFNIELNDESNAWIIFYSINQILSKESIHFYESKLSISNYLMRSISTKSNNKWNKQFYQDPSNLNRDIFSWSIGNRRWANRIDYRRDIKIIFHKNIVDKSISIAIFPGFHNWNAIIINKWIIDHPMAILRFKKIYSQNRYRQNASNNDIRDLA